jgi:hypothetical protein
MLDRHTAYFSPMYVAGYIISDNWKNRRMSAHRVLWRILGPKREEVPEGYRKLHNGGFHNLHPLVYIITVINLRKIR